MTRALMALLLCTTLWPSASWARTTSGSAIDPALEGTFEFQPTLSGNPLNLATRLRFEAHEVRYAGMDIGAVTGTLDRAWWTPQMRLVATVHGANGQEATIVATLPLTHEWGSWVPDETRPYAASVRAVGVDARLFGVGLGGPTRVELDLSGLPSNPKLVGVLSSDAVAYRGAPLGAMTLSARFEDRVMELKGTWDDGDEQIAKLDARLPFLVDLTSFDVSWLDAHDHRIQLVAKHLNRARLAPFWRAPLAARFDLGVEVEVHGTLDQFVATALARGTLQDAQRVRNVSGSIRVDPNRQTLGFWLGERLFGVELATDAPLPAIRRSGYPWDGVALRGRIDAAVPLQTLSPYLPRAVVEPRGKLEGSIHVDGTLNDPQLDGELTVTDGALTLIEMNARLTEAQGKLRARGSSFELLEMTGRVGPGRLSAHGGLVVQATPITSLQTVTTSPRVPLWSAWNVVGDWVVQLSDFPLVHPFVPNGVFDARAAVDLRATPERSEVNIAIAKTDVRLGRGQMQPARAIPRNANVTHVDWTGAVQALAGVSTEGESVVRVSLSEPIDVVGPTMNVRLSGELVVARAEDEVAVEGGFIAEPGGVFSLYENRFVIERGQITVAGGSLLDTRVVSGTSGRVRLRDPDAPTAAIALDPLIDFTAHGFVVDTDIKVTVRGPSVEPELVMESDPELPEYQILTLMITGRADAVDGRGGDVRRKVARLVNRFHNPSLSRQLYDRLGIDKLGLAFGSSVSQPILTVGKQLDRQLYVETTYHHNAPQYENEKEVRVEYQLDQRWSVDTTYGDAAQGSVGLFWQRAFGGPIARSRRPNIEINTVAPTESARRTSDGNEE